MGQKFSVQPLTPQQEAELFGRRAGANGWDIHVGSARAVVADVAQRALDLGKLGRDVGETDVAESAGLEIAAGAVAGFFEHMSESFSTVQERAGAVTVVATEIFDLYERADYEMAAQHQAAAKHAGAGASLGSGW